MIVRITWDTTLTLGSAAGLIGLPKRHTKAEGDETCELTVKVIDVVLVPNLQTQRGVFGYPEIQAPTDVESTLGRGAITVIEAVAPDSKRLDPPVVLLAEKMIGGINRHRSHGATPAETPIGASVAGFDAQAQTLGDKRFSTKTGVYSAHFGDVKVRRQGLPRGLGDDSVVGWIADILGIRHDRGNKEIRLFPR